MPRQRALHADAADGAGAHESTALAQSGESSSNARAQPNPELRIVAKLQRIAACHSTHPQHRACCQGRARLGFVRPVCTSVSCFGSPRHTHTAGHAAEAEQSAFQCPSAIASLSAFIARCVPQHPSTVSHLLKAHSTHAAAPVPHLRLAPSKDSTTPSRVTKSSSQVASVKLRSACRVTLIDEPVFPKHAPAPVSLFSPRPKSPRYHRTN